MISIIIPTLNEADNIQNTIRTIRERSVATHVTEIIVVDGGSTDNTASLANKSGAIVVNTGKGRARQMNAGAAQAQGGILYFLHADSIPPANFTSDIISLIESGYSAGCFRLEFDNDHWFLKANCWFTRFDINAVRFGDQSLIVTTHLFQKSGGFREDLLMMEDQEIIYRIKKLGKFKVLNNAVITSARKYHDNGIYRMQRIFFQIWFLYYLGYSQEKLLVLHRRLIRKHKL